MPTLPAPSIKDDMDGMAEFDTPNSGSMDLAESDTEQKPLLKARNRSRSAFATEPDPDVQTAVIDWLRTKAELKEGYTEYIAARGKPQHNPDVVRHWEFAARFFVQYKKATSGVRNVVRSKSIYIYVKFRSLPCSEIDWSKCRTLILLLCSAWALHLSRMLLRERVLFGGSVKKVVRMLRLWLCLNMPLLMKPRRAQLLY
jgi:hypothetical protein